MTNAPQVGAVPEEDTRRQLAEIEAIYNTAPGDLCVFDTQGRYVRINKRLAEVTGTTVASVEAR